MKLAKKTVAITIIAVTLLGAILYFGLSTIVYDRFVKLERKEVSKNLDRVDNDLKNEISHLVTKTKDWAAWDDTYDFLKTSRKAYISSNLTPESVIQLKIDAIIFFKLDGTLHYAAAVDRENEVSVPLWKDVAKFFSNHKEILSHDSVEGFKSGLIEINDKVGIVSSLPVITSEYKGPIAGTVVFFRFLDKALIEEISLRTKLDLQLHPVDSKTLVGFKNDGITDLISSGGDEEIFGTRVIYDVFKHPLLIAKINMKRDLMGEGYALIRTVLIVLAVSGFLLSLLVVSLLQRTVISRMLRLQAELSNIARSADHEGRVTVQGSDELALLASGINQTLISLQEAKHIAEDASKAKSEFVANMSHELRTPLNGVCAAAELLGTTSLTQDQDKLVSIIDSSAKSLLVLISDVLDISKINAGKMILSPTTFNLRQFITGLIAVHELVANSKKIVIISNLSEDLPKLVFMDQLRLGQILNNLIGNSLKFTPINGAIIFDLSVSKDESGNTLLTFAVSDSGIGVSKEKELAIFEAFAQADSSITRQFGGTGLGLAISSRLVEMMGGSLSLRSIPNYGTRFFFTIPVQESNEVEIKVEESSCKEREKPLRCLLVEDNKTNQFLMSRILGKQNFDITIANDGVEALSLYEVKQFDIILMDCQMPNLDGYSATRKIRELEQGSSKHVPIIALTACAMTEDREVCLQAGMDEYISKPIDQKKLFETINKIVKT